MKWTTVINFQICRQLIQVNIKQQQQQQQQPNQKMDRKPKHIFSKEDIQMTICCCSVCQSCLTLCDPMDCSTSGFPVLHYLSELVQTHVHWVSDGIQPSHPLLFPSPPAFNLSQHHGLFPMSGLFASGGQSIGASASDFPMNTQGWFPLGLTFIERSFII